MWWVLTAITSIALVSANALAEETIKVGLILPMTGPFTTTGKQVEAGARFYMQQNGATVDGRKIEVILRDDAGVADNSKRIAQELLTGDKVNILAGFGLTPITLAVAPLATETGTPMVVMAAATGMLTERSPYIVRSSFPQAARSLCRCGCLCSIRISRPSCSACAMLPRMEFSSSFRPARRRP